MVFVHQEPDGAAVHAVDRLARGHEPVQRLQHEAIAAERDDDVGGLGRRVAVALAQPLLRFHRLDIGACNEGDPLVARGALLALGAGGHGDFGAPARRMRWAAPGPGGAYEHGTRGVRLYDLSLYCRGGGSGTGAGRTAARRLRQYPPWHGVALLVER